MAAGSDWEAGPGLEGAAQADHGGLVPAIARRKGLLFTVLVFGLGLAYLYFLNAERVYQSSAQVLIVKQESEIPLAGVEKGTNYENTLSTHMLLAKSAQVVERAVKKHQLDQLPSLRNVRNPAAVVAASLTTERAGGRSAPDPNVFDIRYRGTDPKDCKVILESVIDSYQESIGETYESVGDQTFELIERAKKDLATQLNDKEAA